MKVPLSTILNEATPRRTGGERLLVHPICYCLTEDASHPAGAGGRRAARLPAPAIEAASELANTIAFPTALDGSLTKCYSVPTDKL
jgi:hypothetical protein